MLVLSVCGAEGGRTCGGWVCVCVHVGKGMQPALETLRCLDTTGTRVRVCVCVGGGNFAQGTTRVCVVLHHALHYNCVRAWCPLLQSLSTYLPTAHCHHPLPTAHYCSPSARTWQR